MSTRCYNCGDFGNHIAAKCPHGPLPKRCHNCKSTEHLIADCPIRTPEKPLVRNGSNNVGLGDGHSSGIGGLWKCCSFVLIGRQHNMLIYQLTWFDEYVLLNYSDKILFLLCGFMAMHMLYCVQSWSEMLEPLRIHNRFLLFQLS